MAPRLSRSLRTRSQEEAGIFDGDDRLVGEGLDERDLGVSEGLQLRAAEADGAKISPLYSASDSPADTIIDIAATFGVDTVVLGGSKRATLVNLLKGNVVTRVAANLPEPMHLIVIG